MLQRAFDAISHARFAELSGDYNPIHMDAIAARRTQVGAPIVHGIHSLLWLLDAIAGVEARIPNVTSLRAEFKSPIYVGDQGRIEVTQRTSISLSARIVVNGIETVLAIISFVEKAPTAAAPALFPPPLPTTSPKSARDLSLQEMGGCGGCLSFGSMADRTRSMFPLAVGIMGLRRMSALVCSSYLVGMIVPGLHSLFMGLNISFYDDSSSATEHLQFSVGSINARHRLVRVCIRGGGVQGSLETVARVPPMMQPRMDSVLKHITRGEFADSTALIVGGSRGLGELTAKLIAGGGGRVVITYAKGKADAAAVAEEILNAGGRCEVAEYDIHKEAFEQLVAARVFPTHLYYFATPPISRRRASPYDAVCFADFNAFYVTGFLNLVQAALRHNPGAIKAFYPSSVFVDARPGNMTEYAMSKAAGEVLCDDINKLLPNVRVFVRRLPRLLTDQTNQSAELVTANPIEELLLILREMHLRADRLDSSTQFVRGR